MKTVNKESKVEDITPEKFFKDPHAEIAANRFDREVIMTIIASLENMGVEIMIRRASPNYSDTLVIQLPKKIDAEQISALLNLRPDEAYVEKGKLVLWWD
jgi:hypothetical protein